MTRPLLLCATVALLLLSANRSDAACDPAETAVATLPAPQQSAVAYRRAEIVGARAAQARDTDVVLLGDSLTELWPDASIRETFGDGALNLGVGSDQTQNVLWRLRDPRYARLAPRRVFLMIGTNNLGTGAMACGVRDGVEAIVERIDALWKTPFLIVVGILPRGPKSSFRAGERLAANAELETLLARRGNAAMITGAEAAFRCGADQCPVFAPDMLHLAPQGYAVLGATIRAATDAARPR